MRTSNKKYSRARKLLWLGLLLLLSFLFYAVYYQLWHQSPRVSSGFYTVHKVLAGHTGEIWSARFGPNGDWVASGSVDSTVRIWDAGDGTVLRAIRQPAGITAVDISPDGNQLVTASYDAKLRCWELPEGKLIKEFIGHTGTVWSVDFSPDGKSIASCGEDATIKLWNVTTGELVRTFQGHSSNVWDIKFSPGGDKLVSGSFDKTVRIWSLYDGKLLHTLTKHSEAIVALSYSPDGQKLVSTSDDKSVKVWDTKSWVLLYSLDVPEHNQAADFSPDNRLLLTGGRDKTTFGELLQNFLGDSEYNKGVSMRLWDAHTGKLLQTFSEHGNDVNDVSFSPDGKRILGASSDKTIRLWKKSD